MLKPQSSLTLNRSRQFVNSGKQVTLLNTGVNTIVVSVHSLSLQSVGQADTYRSIMDVICVFMDLFAHERKHVKFLSSLPKREQRTNKQNTPKHSPLHFQWWTSQTVMGPLVKKYKYILLSMLLKHVVRKLLNSLLDLDYIAVTY